MRVNQKVIAYTVRQDPRSRFWEVVEIYWAYDRYEVPVVLKTYASEEKFAATLEARSLAQMMRVEYRPPAR